MGFMYAIHSSFWRLCQNLFSVYKGTHLANIDCRIQAFATIEHYISRHDFCLAGEKVDFHLQYTNTENYQKFAELRASKIAGV